MTAQASGWDKVSTNSILVINKSILTNYDLKLFKTLSFILELPKEWYLERPANIFVFFCKLSTLPDVSFVVVVFFKNNFGSCLAFISRLRWVPVFDVLLGRAPWWCQQILLQGLTSSKLYISHSTSFLWDGECVFQTWKSRDLTRLPNIIARVTMEVRCWLRMSSHCVLWVKGGNECTNSFVTRNKTAAVWG